LLKSDDYDLWTYGYDLWLMVRLKINELHILNALFMCKYKFNEQITNFYILI